MGVREWRAGVLAIVRRLNPGRGPAGPGLALNLGGRQLLSPAASGAAIAPAVPGAPPVHAVHAVHKVHTPRSLAARLLP